MTRPMVFAAAVLAASLAACAQPEPIMQANAGASSSDSDGIEGLTLRYFRCDNGAAFTVQNYENGSARLTTRAGKAYDLRRSAVGFSNESVSYARSGKNATLTGAEGGPYLNCVQG